GHDAAFVIEIGMREGRTLRRDRPAHVQPDARIPLGAVPVTPVAFDLAEPHWKLVLSGLDLLQAHDVGLLPLDPFLQLRLTSSETVDVPRRHLPPTFVHSTLGRASTLRTTASSGGSVTKAHQRLIVLIAVSVACAAVPSVAFAQRRMPHQEANAIGGEVGMFLPHADGMSTGPVVDGTFEHYLNARDSVRLNVGWMQPQQTGNPNAKMREVRVAGDLVHNWEGGSVHPFL